MNNEALARLRAPFPQSEIRYLPRVWCGACRDSRAGCTKHERRRCNKCGNNLSTAHIDLSYVGHAEATNRLLNVDPAWSWEPLASDEKGLPQFDANGGLWIRLTVCGVTRLGYGNAEGKRGGDAVKEIIGDAIRNAGMRFGMALDLWTSSDLEIAESGPREAVPESSGARPQSAPPQQSSGPPRDFLTEARGAADSATVRRLWQDARVAGAAPEYLQQIADIGRQKSAAEQADDGVVDGKVGDEPPVDEHATAVAELRAFATQAGITNIDTDAYGALGAPLADVSPAAIRGLLAQLNGTAA